jgi:hypothetical protein
MKISFVAGFGPIVADTETSKNFYGGALGIVFIEEPGGYLHTGDLPGVQHFALWPLAQAAESCFGVDRWPSEVPAPTSWIEFDVEDVAARNWRSAATPCSWPTARSLGARRSPAC